MRNSELSALGWDAWFEEQARLSCDPAGGMARVAAVDRDIRDLDDDSKYIKAKHPEIWKKLHPWGDYSHSSPNGIAFLGGQYDDGSADGRLNEIKKKYVAETIPFIWALGLVLISFFMTFALLSGE